MGTLHTSLDTHYDQRYLIQVIPSQYYNCIYRPRISCKWADDKALSQWQSCKKMLHKKFLWTRSQITAAAPILQAQSCKKLLHKKFLWTRDQLFKNQLPVTLIL